VVGPAPAALVGRPAAATAVDDALAEGSAFAHRAGTGVGVVGGQFRLVSQKLVPGDIAGMLADEGRLPFGPGHVAAAAGDPPVGGDHSPAAPPAEDVGAGVGRVGQHLQHPVVGQGRPGQLAGLAAAGEPAAGERADHPVGRTGRGEGGEQVADRGLHLLVGVDRDGSLVVADEPGGKLQLQLAAGRGGSLRLVHPAAQDVQFDLGAGCSTWLAIRARRYGRMRRRLMFTDSTSS
jgi:hypothetical protein